MSHFAGEKQAETSEGRGRAAGWQAQEAPVPQEGSDRPARRPIYPSSQPWEGWVCPR